MVERRRGVTRAYVAALVAAVCIVAVALVVALWGLLTLALGRGPITTDGVPTWAAPTIVLVEVLALGVSLWQQALALLRGRVSPAWAQIISVTGASYLLWCLGAMLAGASIGETWLSPFALALAAAALLSCLMFWAVLARRVYTDLPTPKWPWERDADDEVS